MKNKTNRAKLYKSFKAKTRVDGGRALCAAMIDQAVKDWRNGYGGEREKVKIEEFLREFCGTSSYIMRKLNEDEKWGGK